MKHRFYHTAFTFVLATVLLFGGNVARVYADNAKRPSGAKTETTKDRSAKSVGKYLSPIDGAVSVAIGTIAGSSNSRQQVRVAAGTDTTRHENRIVFARASSDLFTTRIELAADETQLEVGIYNMLGKKVMEVHKGAASRGPHEYTLAIPDLPEGVYICIMQGRDFRKAEKFFLSR